MADYSADINLAYEMLNEFGMPMTYLSITEVGRIDPDTGKRPVTVEKVELYGVKTAPTVAEVQRGQFQGLSLVVLAPGGVINGADITDVIQFDGHDYDIKEIVSIAPAEKVILYKFGVQDAGKIGNSSRLRGKA